MPPQQARTEAATAAAECFDIRSLTEVMARTLPQAGLDRMTSEKVEEVMAVAALTAHI
ncbi:hypothetical protein [Streptomyces sp. 130]|uniref:hypothetical protein n=1 Tax=Streptomyces sp. 130 TaxID=2591006 RepID=UPI00163D5357|nr:hypothetical protein [Streptomyces sp. 130]